MPHSRHFSLDALRGFAVMGILLMNIIGFSMPMTAYVNPQSWGGSSGADFWAWASASVLVDGKMRGIFSLLFGASMLLIIERADAAGQNADEVHFRRMGWLFLFGLFHFWFIWAGDILALYAICGALAYGMRDLSPRALIVLGIGLMLLNMLLWGIVGLEFHEARFLSQSAGASAEARARYSEILGAIGAPGTSSATDDIALHLGTYVEIVQARFSEGSGGLIGQLIADGPTTIGLMAWGMALLKMGALTGQWSSRTCLKAAAVSYAIGLPSSALLVGVSARSGFDPLTLNDIFYIWSAPPRMAVMMGHLMVLLWLIQTAHGALMERIAAAGRMAFSNYIGTSVLMTMFFYGYGFGYYGSLSRWQVYLIVPFVWAVILFWSKPWLDTFRYGPLEWLWRSLARWERQAFRKG